jgi:hypothetical protein
VLAQLVEDLVHLEGGGHGLDEDGRAHGPALEAERLLGVDEDVVPEPRLQVALRLRQVEVRPGAAFEQALRVVEREQPEVEQRARHALLVDHDVAVGQVPAAGTHQQRRRLVAQPVGPLALGVLDGPVDRVDEVGLPADHVRPGGRQRVLEVGHESARAGVEGVDHHLPVGRAGDLDAPVLQCGRRRRHAPVGLAQLAGLGEEVRQLAGVPAGHPVGASGHQLAPARVELAVQAGHELERVGAQDLGHALGLDAPLDGDAHRCSPRIDMSSSSTGCTTRSSRPSRSACRAI